MKINLDKIENNLQLLFESSIRLLSGVDFSRMVIHNLVRAMEGSMFTRPDGLLTASHIYTIRVHPDMLDAWQSKQDVLDQLSNELIKSAGDAGVVFLYAPVIRLAADEHQNQDQITITPSLSEKAVGETSAVILRNGTELPQEKHHKKDSFLIKDGSTIIPISENPFNIGRRPTNHLVLEDPRVSRSHAQIRLRHSRHIVLDLNSLGGTYVNGQRIFQHELKSGDVISLAGVSLIYSEENQADMQDTGGYTTTIDVSNSTGKEDKE